MATPVPFSQIYDLFQGMLTDSQKSKIENTAIEKSLIINVFSEFEIFCRYDNYIDDYVDFNTEVINDELTSNEKIILALLMLREYYWLERVKYSKLVSIITDSTKINGINDSRKALQQDYDDVQRKIDKMLITLF